MGVNVVLGLQMLLLVDNQLHGNFLALDLGSPKGTYILSTMYLRWLHFEVFSIRPLSLSSSENQQADIQGHQDLKGTFRDLLIFLYFMERKLKTGRTRIMCCLRIFETERDKKIGWYHKVIFCLHRSPHIKLWLLYINTINLFAMLYRISNNSDFP